MSVEINGKEYHGIKAVLYSIPVFAFIGFAFLGVGLVLTSPLWLLIFLVYGMP